MERNRHRLLALITANRDRPKRREIENATGPEATVYLYDSIDSYFGVNAEAFIKDFNAITAPMIHLRINSPGGDVFDARAIATAIGQHASTVVAHVDGLAASAASYIAIAADQVEMAPGSFLMIHKAWTIAFGNSDDLLSTAALLEKIDGSLAADYAKKTGQSSAQIEDWMSAETWFTAEEAVAEGFAGKVSEDTEAVENAWDLSVFAHAPKPKAVPAPKKDGLAITVECDSTQAVAALARIEAAAKAANAAIDQAANAARKVADDEAAATDQANMEHAERVRRFQIDFA
jgi:ATP-dependent Clp protease protease subunit